jgi:hypothetical protein
MLIRVMYQDGKIAEIEDYQLDNLIYSKKIKKFQRSGQWVTIGVDPIRKVREDYPEISESKKSLKKATKKN